jgi:hypothetical protein
MFQNLLKETDTTDGLRLPPPGFTISGILAPVPLGASFRDDLAYLGIDHIDKVFQLGRNLVISLF